MSHVSTTVTTTTTATNTTTCVNLGYTRTNHGMLQVAVVVVLLIAFLCVHFSQLWTDYSTYNFFEVVTIGFQITFLIFLIMHIFQLQGKIPCINWTMTEFVTCILAAFLIFIASIVAAVKSYRLSPLIAGSVFGFFATGLLVINIWVSYKIRTGSQHQV